MLTIKTPFRISLLGGSSDYPSWYKQTGQKGLVLGFPINKYSYIIARRLPAFFDYQTRVVYSQTETVVKNSDIEHSYVNEAIRHLGMDDEGLEIIHAADLPSKSGTGSSSAFLVSLLHALHRIKNPDANGQYDTRRWLAEKAIEIEQSLTTVGSQDQLLCALGGVQEIHFSDKISISEHFGCNTLSDYIMMFYTNISRVSSEVASKYIPSISSKKEQIKEIVKLANQGCDALLYNNYQRLGKLVSQSWEQKMALSPHISSPKINEYYQTAIDAGAWGGKLMGAGGGGCMFFIVPPDKQLQVKQALSSLIYIDVRIDHKGTRLVESM